jgi:multidrug efflux pump subunit AcrB
MFTRLLAGYEWALKRSLTFGRRTLCVFLGTLVLTVVLYPVIPKGLFPEQDTGLIFGSAEGAQDTRHGAAHPDPQLDRCRNHAVAAWHAAIQA